MAPLPGRRSVLTATVPGSSLAPFMVSALVVALTLPGRPAGEETAGVMAAGASPGEEGIGK
ncbi:MAG TPA: hypothetical protein VMT31_00920 [Methanomicrobiales archaeon]|nr:hypothetical protein [Methanomicrobiales archaeon]